MSLKKLAPMEQIDMYNFLGKHTSKVYLSEFISDETELKIKFIKFLASDEKNVFYFICIDRDAKNNNGHWTLAFIERIKFERVNIYFYNSFARDMPEKYKSIFMKFHALFDEINFFHKSAIKDQEDLVSCGYLSLIVLRDILRYIDIRSFSEIIFIVNETEYGENFNIYLNKLFNYDRIFFW